MIAEELQVDSSPFILILGGTDFMGKTLLDHLHNMPYRICCINRGKNHWYSIL